MRCCLLDWRERWLQYGREPKQNKFLRSAIFPGLKLQVRAERFQRKNTAYLYSSLILLIFFPDFSLYSFSRKNVMGQCLPRILKEFHANCNSIGWLKTTKLAALCALSEFLDKHFPLCLPFKSLTFSPILSNRLFTHKLPLSSIWKLISAIGCKDLYSCSLSSRTEVLSNPTQPLHFQKGKPPPVGRARQSQIYLISLEPRCLLTVTSGEDAYFNFPLFTSVGGLDDRKCFLLFHCNCLKPGRNDEELEINISWQWIRISKWRVKHTYGQLQRHFLYLFCRFCLLIFKVRCQFCLSK